MRDELSSSGEHGKRRVRAALLLAGLVLFSPSPPLEAQEPGKDDNPGPRECSEIDDSCYPSVHINNLLSELDSGQSDAFVAGAIDLESTERYKITVSRESGNTDIGFNSTCSTVSESVTVPAGRTSYDLSPTLWACGAPGGAVTATLSRKDIIGPHVIYTTVDTESQTVTVNPPPPPAPTGVRADATGKTSVNVRWDYRAGISRYRVERRKSGASQWTTVSSYVTGTSRSVTGLECGAAYDFRVSAYGDGTAFAAEWSQTAEDSAGTDPCTPVPPTGVRADATGKTSVSVRWDYRAGISRYRVERRKSGGSWTTVSSYVTGTSRSVTGLECGAAYDFRVSAYGDGTAFAAEWSQTSQASTRTGTCLDPPGAPPSARAWATGQNGIQVRWFQQRGVVKFRVEQLAPPNKETGEDATWVTLDQEINGGSYTDSELNCNTARLYRVSGYGDGTVYAAEWGPYATYPWVTTDSCSRFHLTPNTLALGGTSEVWPVPSGVAGVYLDVHFSEALSKDDSNRNIKIRRLSIGGTVMGTYEVASEAHSGLLPFVSGGSRIRIDVDADAFDQQAALVSLAFHTGSDATTGAIAHGSVQKEARPPQPLPGVPPAVVDEDNETVTLDWVEGADVPNDNPHHYLAAFYDSLRTVVYSETVDYSSPDATTLDIDQAWDKLGAGTHTAEVSLCNATGGCSLPLLITFTLPFRFTPSPLALGETSDNVWTVPPEVTSVYLQVAFSAGATGAIGPGDINIQRIRRVGSTVSVLRTYEVDDQNDDGILDGVTAGSLVRIAAGADAFHAQAADVTLAFRSGAANGPVIARGSVDTQARPSAPPGRVFTPALTPGDRSLTARWNAPSDGGATITSYNVQYKEAAASSWTSAGPVSSGIEITIMPTNTPLINGTPYHVQVQACNSVGCGQWSLSATGTPRTVPGRVLTPALTPGDRSLTARWNAPSDGGATITSYNVQYKEAASSSWTSAGAVSFATEITIMPANTPLINGTSYDVQVQACNAAGCGLWSVPATGTPNLLLGPPANLRISGDPDLNTTVAVAYDRVGPLHHYQFELYQASTPNGNYILQRRALDYLSPLEFTGMSIGYWYKARGRHCRTYTATPAPVWSGCGSWSAYSGPFLLKLFPPTGLDITPLPLRKARLTWELVADASGYVVEVQATGGNWQSPNRIILPSPTVLSRDIPLDEVLTLAGNVRKGLADAPHSYDFRVVATHATSAPGRTTMPGGNSDPSNAITIKDNPLLDEGRAYAPNGSQAKLEWTTDPNATNYEIRYRQLGENNAFLQRPTDHTSLDWPDDESWPFYHLAQTASPDSPGKKTITSLDEGKIYAFQINYEIGGTKVFSARDAYVWPSDELPKRDESVLSPDSIPLPENTSRVGTYPFFGYWEGGRYDYTICPATFTPNNVQWQNLIVHAFEQWEEAASNRVTVTHVLGACTTEGDPIDNNVPITLIKALHNGSNEVYMVDMDWNLSNWKNVLLHNKLFLCIRDAEACVISPRYWDVTWMAVPFRQSVRILDPGSVDVLLNRTIVTASPKSRDIPGGDAVVDAADIQFNTCRRNPNANWDNYELMVHESGHALGLSGFFHTAILNDAKRYDMAHPTIPGTVMNYDGEESIRYPVGANFREPDCSPHPFDVMAIEALYQTLVP